MYCRDYMTFRVLFEKMPSFFSCMGYRPILLNRNGFHLYQVASLHLSPAASTLANFAAVDLTVKKFSKRACTYQNVHQTLHLLETSRGTGIQQFLSVIV